MKGKPHFVNSEFHTPSFCIIATFFIDYKTH
jgi:hypothetical protein